VTALMGLVERERLVTLTGVGGPTSRHGRHRSMTSGWVSYLPRHESRSSVDPPPLSTSRRFRSAGPHRAKTLNAPTGRRTRALQLPVSVGDKLRVLCDRCTPTESV